MLITVTYLVTICKHAKLLSPRKQLYLPQGAGRLGYQLRRRAGSGRLGAWEDIPAIDGASVTLAFDRGLRQVEPPTNDVHYPIPNPPQDFFTLFLL